MKRLIALCLCLALGLSFSVPAVAATGTSLSATTSEVQVGDTVTLTVSVSGAAVAKSVGIAVDYNSNKFELVSGNWLISGAAMSTFDPGTAKGALMYSTETDMNGSIFTVTLRAISTSTAAEVVSASVQLKNGTTDVYSGAASKSITIICTSHSFGEWATTTVPGCESQGVQTRFCANCPATDTQPVAATGHSGEWVETSAPGCVTDGVETRLCSVCGGTETRPVAATGHSGEWLETSAPGCATAGEETRNCSVCGGTETRPIAATGHSYGDWEETTTPGCETDGEKAKTCASCGDTQTEVISALGHDYGSVVTDPTCTEGGFTTHTCSRCSDTYTDSEAEALSHDYQTEVTEPTCTEEGYTTHTCSRCGDSYTSDVTGATGHSYGDWEETTAPGCETVGEKLRTCSVCGGTETEDIPTLGHDYQTEVTEPTCTEEGYTTYTCGRCESEYDADFVPTLGHSWDGGVITRIPVPGVSGEILYTCGTCEELRSVEHNIVVSDEVPARVVSGKTLTLTAKDLAANETLKAEAIKWTLSDEYAAFAAVTAKGVLTAKAVENSVEIKVIGTLVSDQEIRVEHALMVYPATSSVSISDNTGAEVGGTTVYFNRNTTENMSFAAVTSPDDALDGIIWSSSDTKGTYATYTDNGDGTVTISGVKKNGTVTLTAKADDGSGKNGKVTVKIGYYATDIAITNAPEAMRGGASLTLKHSLTADSSLTSKAVVWSVSEESIPYAKIDSKGKLITYAVSEPVTITVTVQSKENPAACQSVDIDLHPAVRSVAVEMNGETLNSNQLIEMELYTGAVDFDTYSEPYDSIQSGTWTSSNKKVATIENDGVVTAVAPGTATMTFKAGDGSAKSIKVKVKVYKESTDLALTAPATELVSGKYMTVKAALTAADGSAPTTKTLVWSSSDTSVATVTSSGKVTAKTVYVNTPVTITATPKDGGAAAQSVTITVQPTKPDTLVLYYEGANVSGKTVAADFDLSDVGSLSASLYSKVSGIYSESAGIVWSSSNTKVAAFDENGQLYFAGGSGSATITGKCGTLSSKFTLKVTKLSKNLVLTAPAETLISGKYITVKAALTASDGAAPTTKTLVWSSSNPAAATVSSSGKVTAKTVYENTPVTITATPKDGGAEAQSVTITVQPTKAEALNIRADGSNVVNKTLTVDYDSPAPFLTAEIYNREQGAYSWADGIVWSSSNTKVATVDENGFLSYTGVGSATITAKQGKTSVKFTLKVTRQVAEITVANKNGITEIISGKTLQLTATVQPSNASVKGVVWSSSDKSVATVSSSGKVTAKTVYARKEVTITAAAKDGSGVVGQVTLTILPKATTVSIVDSTGRILNNRTVTVSLAELGELDVGARVYPRGEDGAQQRVKWSSSSTKTASISADGVITLKKTGTVTIKATAADGSQKTTSFKLVITK